MGKKIDAMIKELEKASDALYVFNMQNSEQKTSYKFHQILNDIRSVLALGENIEAEISGVR